MINLPLPTNYILSVEMCGGKAAGSHTPNTEWVALTHFGGLIDPVLRTYYAALDRCLQLHLDKRKL